MKVCMVGAPPQFIKGVPVSRELRRVAPEVLIHSGPHYDRNIAELFFQELNIPTPDYNIGIGSDLQGAQSGAPLLPQKSS